MLFFYTVGVDTSGLTSVPEEFGHFLDDLKENGGAIREFGFKELRNRCIDISQIYQMTRSMSQQLDYLELSKINDMTDQRHGKTHSLDTIPDTWYFYINTPNGHSWFVSLHEPSDWQQKGNNVHVEYYVGRLSSEIEIESISKE